MRKPKLHSILNKEKRQKTTSQPRVAMLFVYIIVGLSLCVFGASVWFSSYAKTVYINRRPIFDSKREKIQYEIHKLELEEHELTQVERVRLLVKELGLVESTSKIIKLQNK